MQATTTGTLPILATASTTPPTSTVMTGAAPCCCTNDCPKESASNRHLHAARCWLNADFWSYVLQRRRVRRRLPKTLPAAQGAPTKPCINPIYTLLALLLSRQFRRSETWRRSRAGAGAAVCGGRLCDARRHRRLFCRKGHHARVVLLRPWPHPLHQLQVCSLVIPAFIALPLLHVQSGCLVGTFVLLQVRDCG